MRLPFAEVFENQVSSEAEADEDDARIRCRRMPDHPPEIARFPAMVEAQQPVRLFAAAAEAPCQRVPARTVQRGRHPADVTVLGASLQSVGEDRNTIPAL